ncbi:MAG: T9SS type A sorting domain-containing protein [Chitinophagales bacterium]
MKILYIVDMKTTLLILISFWLLIVKAEKITVDSDGNVYLCGVVQDTLTFSDSTMITTNPWNRKSYLAKLDSVGDVLWLKVFDNEFGFNSNLKIDNSNNLLLITKFSGILELDTNNIVSGSSCLLIIKYDSYGELLWYSISSERSISSSADGSFGIDSRNNIYTIGKLNGLFILNGVDTLINTTDNLLVKYIAKFDSTGANIWLNKLFGDNASIYEIDTDEEGNSVIVGNFYDTLSYQGNILISPGSFGSFDGFWLKIDSNGDLISMKKISSSRFNRIYSVGLSINGIFSYSGKYLGDGDTLFIDNFPLVVDVTDYAYTDGNFFVQVNNQNTVNWLINFNSEYGGYKYHGVDMDNLGYSYLYTLYDEWRYNTSLNSFVGSDISNSNYVIKIDSNGNFACLIHVENGRISDIEVTDDGEVFIVGNFQNTLSLNGISYSQNDNNIFVSRFDSNCNNTSTTLISNPITGINEKYSKIELKVYPNPTQNILNIETSSQNHQINNIQIIDINGRNVVHANQSPINTSELTQGIYFYQVEMRSGELVRGKFVKQ